MERRIALVENVAIANHAMSHIREGLQNVSNDSDVHPIQYGGLNLCAIAESLLKNLFLIQIQNVSNDSDEYPIQYGGLNLCAIAESLLKKLSPLQQLTKDEISAIRAKIEDPDGEIVLGRGQKRKTLNRLGNEIISFIREKCWCLAFQRP